MPLTLNLKKLRPLKFEWDKGNKEKNWLRHKVKFSEAEEIFFNRPLKTFYDIKHSQKKDRFAALGITNKGRKLTIIFTIRNKKIRVISARDQGKGERKLYEKK